MVNKDLRITYHTLGYDEALTFFDDLNWHRFEDSFKQSDAAFQTRFTDDKGIKYFLNAYIYDFSQYKPSAGIGVSYDMQLTTCEDQCINIELPASDWSINEIETKVNKLFENNILKYYEEWQ